MKKKWNHPCHLHALNKADTQEIYGSYQAKWRCDTCQKVFDGFKDGILSSESGEEAESRHSYHCTQCNFDICTQCFRGYLHAFHFHRLQKARAPLIYTETNGQWRCDACKRVFNELTEQMCYHCQLCAVDMCEKCFRGEWSHVLHKGEHFLKPVDPRIEYRYHYDWICDNCQKTFSRRNTPNVFFHCSECQFDLCPDCFMGEKHYLHQHRLARIKHSRHTTLSLPYCSHCTTQISGPAYHVCHNPTCQYTLCGKCYASSPQSHPYHPEHPLERCDASEVYPQSCGMWHCDHCTSLTKEPSPLPPSEPMYHCMKCEYDLCEQCFENGLKKQNMAPEEAAVRPIQVQEEHTPSYQPYTMNYYSSGVSSRPVVTSTQSLSFLSTPLVPSHRLCTVCRTYPATMTFIHKDRPHYGPAICCQACASDTLNYKRGCPVCGLIPDSVADAHMVNNNYSYT